jgi:hypothetical protein
MLRTIYIMTLMINYYHKWCQTLDPAARIGSQAGFQSQVVQEGGASQAIVIEVTFFKLDSWPQLRGLSITPWLECDLEAYICPCNFPKLF